MAGECFAEGHSILVLSGVIRIVVPDLVHIVNRYTAGKIEADRFIEQLDDLYTRNSNPFKNKLSTIFQFPHKCMYDTKALLRVMDEIGFECAAKLGF